MITNTKPLIVSIRDVLIEHKDKASIMIEKFPAYLKLLEGLSAMMTSMVQEQDELEVSAFRRNYARFKECSTSRY